MFGFLEPLFVILWSYLGRPIAVAGRQPQRMGVTVAALRAESIGLSTRLVPIK